MENKKVPRVIRKTEGLQRREHFNEKVLLAAPGVAEYRLEICKTCSSYEDYGCKVSGFFMPKVTTLKAQTCPYGKWSADYRLTPLTKEEK